MKSMILSFILLSSWGYVVCSEKGKDNDQKEIKRKAEENVSMNESYSSNSDSCTNGVSCLMPDQSGFDSGPSSDYMNTDSDDEDEHESKSEKIKRFFTYLLRSAGSERTLVWEAIEGVYITASQTNNQDIITMNLIQKYMRELDLSWYE